MMHNRLFPMFNLLASQPPQFTGINLTKDTKPKLINAQLGKLCRVISALGEGIC